MLVAVTWIPEIWELTNFLSDSTTSILGYFLIFSFVIVSILEMIDKRKKKS